MARPRLLQIRQFPGIGKYTAHAVASFAFNESVPIVESNTARVFTRLFNFRKPIDSDMGRKRLWQNAAMLVPKANALTYNSALIDLGALVCVPRQPKCGVCPVKKFCRAKNPETLPVRKSPPRTKRLIENHSLIVSRSRILLQKADRRWRGLWILPLLQKSPANQQSIYKGIFPFTNHRITLNVFAQRQHKIDRRLQRWIKINSLESIPIPSAHRRALRHLLNGHRQNYMTVDR